MRHLRSTHPADLGGAEDGNIAPAPRPAIDTAGPSKQGMHCMKFNSDHKVLTLFRKSIFLNKNIFKQVRHCGLTYFIVYFSWPK